MALSSNRRHFLLSSIGVTIYTTPFVVLGLNACKTATTNGATKASLSSDSISGTAAHGMTIRKSATDPSNVRNVMLYREAVAKMKATPFPILLEGRQVSWWEAQADIHNTSCPHGNWYFLPWHRGYLHHFERVCREFCGDPHFALPYWDWSEDSRLPEPFTTGNEQTNSLFNETRFMEPRQALDLVECTQQYVQSLIDISDFATFAGGASDRPRAPDDAPPKEEFGYSGRLEAGPHNRVHATMQGDMGTFTSPRDPVFWLHHCNVDRLWTIWASDRTRKNQDILPSDPPSSYVGARLTRDYWLNSKVGGYYLIKKELDNFTATPTDFKVAELFDATKMGLAYQEISQLSLAATPISQDGQAPETPKPSIPAVVTESSLKNRWQAVVKKVIILKMTSIASRGVGENVPSIIRIDSTPELEAALAAASQARGTKEATLRMVVRNIPFPSSPQARLNFYMNAQVSSGAEKSPNFIGSMSFFGHKHEGATVSTVFDLVPTIKKLVAANQKPFGASEPLMITAVWQSNPASDNLRNLKIAIDYLELG